MSGLDWLGQELTTMALCWRLDRADGVTMGFTTHDRTLTIGGVPYGASPGMLPSAVRQSDGFDVDTLDVDGALTADAITADDLAVGRWDGAALSLFAADWSDPAADPLPIARGEIGDVSIQDGAFTAELRGPTALLERPVVEQTSPDCRASLGDARCRIGLQMRRSRAGLERLIVRQIGIDRQSRGWRHPAPGGRSHRRHRGRVIWQGRLNG